MPDAPRCSCKDAPFFDWDCPEHGREARPNLHPRPVPPVAADPVVSPADTHAAAIRAALGVIARETAYSHEAVNRYALVEAVSDAAVALAALLAVGERDKAEIERLTAEVEAHNERERVAAQNFLRQIDMRRDAQNQGERDRQHIAQLTEAAELAAEKIEYAQETATGWLTYRAAMQDALAYLRAVLADKEDARPDGTNVLTSAAGEGDT